MSIEEKKAILKEECNINITNEGRELLEGMCNLGEGIFERGVEQGIIKSIIRMLESGMSESQVIDILRATQEQIQKAKVAMQSQ